MFYGQYRYKDEKDDPIIILKKLVLLLNKSGVWLPAAEHRHILKTKTGEEGKRSLVKWYTIWGNGNLPNSRTISSAIHRKKPSASQETETQNHAQKSHSVLLCPSETEATKQTVLCLQTPWSLRVCAGWGRGEGAGAAIITLLVRVPRGLRSLPITLAGCVGLHRVSCGVWCPPPGYVATRSHQSHKSSSSHICEVDPRERGSLCFPSIEISQHKFPCTPAGFTSPSQSFPCPRLDWQFLLQCSISPYCHVDL